MHNFFIVTSNLQNRPTPMNRDQAIFTGHKLPLCKLLASHFQLQFPRQNAFNNDIAKLNLGQVHDTSS